MGATSRGLSPWHPALPLSELTGFLSLVGQSIPVGPTHQGLKKWVGCLDRCSRTACNLQQGSSSSFVTSRVKVPQIQKQCLSMTEYRKTSKTLDTQTNGCNYLKIVTMRFYHRIMPPKAADWEKQSDQGLHCSPRPVCLQNFCKTKYFYSNC